MPRLLERSARPIAPPPQPRPTGRVIHPGAWWAWAVTVALAASLTDSLPTLCAFAVVLVVVATLRRADSGFGRSMRFYLMLAGFIVVIRMIFRIVFGGAAPGTVLFRLPEIALPEWAAGIRLGGPVTVEGLLLTATDSGRLAVLILAVGAAMTLADPRTTLKSVPAALHDISVAVVITLTVLPAIVTSGQRVMRSKRLRGHTTRGLRSLLSTIIPVLEDAVEGSMTLATSMEVRGYGRTRTAPKGATTGLLLGSIVLLTCGAFVLLGVAPKGPEFLHLAAETWLALGLLLTGGAGAIVALRASGRRLATTRYRPMPWGWPERRIVATGVSCAAVAVGMNLAAPDSWWILLAPPLALLALPLGGTR